MRYTGKTNELLEIVTITSDNCYVLKESKENELSLLWFETDENILNIDTIDHTFHKNQIVCLTEFHKIKVKNVGRIRLIRFNKEFYCILNHDSEVSCKGILFFGSSQLPIMEVSGQDLDVLEAVWNMFLLEMQSRDELQMEMLQMMLKRFLILCTRIYKQQNEFEKVQHDNVDIIREFNYLVEAHFDTKHTVAEYADLLNKSPKTISNIFRTMGSKTPLQFIQDRKMLEARRQLAYTDKPVKEIAYDLGYLDIQTFSRFFKKQEGVSPMAFRKTAISTAEFNLSA